MKKNKEGIAILFDSYNLKKAVKFLQLSNSVKGRIDYDRVLDFFKGEDEYVFKKFYMVKPLGSVDQYFLGKYYGFKGYLRSCGFEIFEKNVKVIKDGRRTVFKGDCDAEMIIDIMDLVYLDVPPRKLVLVSGDSDFLGPVERLAKEGVEVEILSTYNTYSIELISSGAKCHYLENIWSEIVTLGEGRVN